MPTHEEDNDAAASSLPTLGRPLKTWGTTRGAAVLASRRRDKVNLWSAVALQQHVALTASALAHIPHEAETGQAAETCLATLPPVQPHGRLTLAQKMGLVPLPPPAPTEAEWRHVVASAVAREARQPLGDQICSICHEPFYTTMDQGQVILSCSHVFHERCFRQFERFARRRPCQRLVGGVVAEDNALGGLMTTSLACPVCRRTHYRKRVYFAGKALAQRAAIVRIQAAARGFCARRRYLQMRLEHDAIFRTSYAQQKLARLSAAWETYLQRREAARELVMEDLQVRQEAALAAYLLETDWQQLIARCLDAARARVCCDDVGASSEAAAGGSALTTSASMRSTVTGATRDECDEGLECPICLERVQRGLRHAQSILQSGTDKARSNDDDEGCKETNSMIVELRRQYERKRAGQSTATVDDKPKETRRGGSKSSHAKQRCTPTTAAHRRAPARGQREGMKTQTPVSPRVALGGVTCEATAMPTTRFAVILSCGHCFHDACLASFERYMTWQATELGGPVAPRCPVCRRGYAKHEL